MKKNKRRNVHAYKKGKSNRYDSDNGGFCRNQLAFKRIGTEKYEENALEWNAMRNQQSTH